MSILIKNIIENDSDMSFLSGNLEYSVSGISSIEEIIEEKILFIGAKKFLAKYRDAGAGDNLALIIDTSLFESLDDSEKKELENNSIVLLTSSNIPISITKASKLFFDEKLGSLNYDLDGRKSSLASIHPSVKIAENVFVGEGVEIAADCIIMPGCVILPNVKIAENCTIYPNVTIYPQTVIGKNCRIHSGTTIGSDGFGYNFHQGVHHKIWHFGGVEIGDDVEIGSNTSIDQGTFSPTRIGSGVKIDNLVQVAHNVKVGNGVILCGQAGLGGSTKIGDYAVLGGKAAVADNLEVGMAAQLAGGSVAIGNVKPKEIVGGYPARPMREFLRGIAFLRKNI
ncbi:UDP-3-O-(3-hydroxymyristoyl)glucosamine N-acyltransferase [Halobacteriovorax sp. RT-2-6]|uniref:UDP-3-O-(3-hydroxymyristoyl)glucosamine N-acyltransferase n=1 Tax=unclassified Halobacteriovorax TaxID=2639665 RepID=UPI00399A67C0